LTLLGIGSLLIVDRDHVEISNLSRSVLFRESDAGSPKASIAARELSTLNPEVELRAICGDIVVNLGAGELVDCDMEIGCVGSSHARWSMNRLCMAAGKPWINAGINASVGEVSMHIPGDGACYECGMTESMWARFQQSRSCTMLARSAPAGVI